MTKSCNHCARVELCDLWPINGFTIVFALLREKILFVEFSSEKMRDATLSCGKRAELSKKDIIPTFPLGLLPTSNSVSIVCFGETYSHLRTMCNVHTANKCLQKVICFVHMHVRFVSNWDCILDEVSFFFFVLNCTRVVVSSIVFSLNSKLSLECMHFKGYFNLCLFFHDCTKGVDAQTWFEIMLFTQLKFQLNRIFIEIIAHDFKTELMCVAFVCVQRRWINAHCADDLESDHYQSVWHFRHTTSPQVFSIFTFLLHSFDFHLFLHGVSFWENKTREIHFFGKQTALCFIKQTYLQINK